MKVSPAPFSGPCFLGIKNFGQDWSTMTSFRNSSIKFLLLFIIQSGRNSAGMLFYTQYWPGHQLVTHLINLELLQVFETGNFCLPPFWAPPKIPPPPGKLTIWEIWLGKKIIYCLFTLQINPYWLLQTRKTNWVELRLYPYLESESSLFRI